MPGTRMPETGMMLSRRWVLAATGAGLLLPFAAGAQAVAITVHKDPSCGCCGGWVEHLRQSGYAVTVAEPADLEAVKLRLGIPEELRACHTATLGTYAIEGHAPAHAIARLIAEQPRIAGIAVPGMPVGSPGMEGGRPEIYDVVAFAGAQRYRFGRYRGAQPV